MTFNKIDTPPQHTACPRLISNHNTHGALDLRFWFRLPVRRISVRFTWNWGSSFRECNHFINSFGCSNHGVSGSLGVPFSHGICNLKEKNGKTFYGNFEDIFTKDRPRHLLSFLENTLVDNVSCNHMVTENFDEIKSTYDTHEIQDTLSVVRVYTLCSLVTYPLKFNFKIFDVTTWFTNNYNTHIAQYLTK